MSDWIDRFILYDEVSPEEREQLGEALKGRTDVATAYAEWKQLRGAIRSNIEESVQDRHLLIQFSLWRSGHINALTPEELSEVERNRRRFEEAIESSEALRNILDCIEDEQQDFEETWRLHAEGEAKKASPTFAGANAPAWRPVRPSFMPFLRVAAVIAVVAASALMYAGLVDRQNTVSVRAATDGVESVNLDDGSSVRLINGAELTYEKSTAAHPFNRRVSLKGRALFTVKPASKVFVVETPAAITTVWGTTFGLDSDDSFTEVVLAEGRVSVVSRRDSQHPVVLEPGQMTRVVGAREPTDPVKVNVADALAWTRLFVFRNEKTERIADRLSEHFGVPIRIDESLQHETVTGTFEQDWSLQYILEAVSQTLDANVTGSMSEGFEVRPRRQASELGVS
ncbi:MAG: FecR domain-containing protein [Rhodothermales bacterium]